MSKQRGLLLIVISLALAIVAAWSARNWVQARLKAGVSPADPIQHVVVAAMEIPFGTKMEGRHLKVITLPISAAVGDHFEKTDDVVGLIALRKRYPGRNLLKGGFADRQCRQHTRGHRQTRHARGHGPRRST